MKEIHVFLTSHRNTQSNAQKIFYGSKPKQNSSWVKAQNTHSVCRTSCHVCSSADKHMVDITERLLSCRNQWTRGRGSPPTFFSFLSSSYPYSSATRTQVSRAVTQHLSDTRKDRDSFPDCLPKCVKGSHLNRWNNQSLQYDNKNTTY